MKVSYFYYVVDNAHYPTELEYIADFDSELDPSGMVEVLSRFRPSIDYDSVTIEVRKIFEKQV